MALVAMTSAAGNLVKAVDRSNLDPNTSPGTNFYQYACGGWMLANPLDPQYARFGTFDQLAENSRLKDNYGYNLRYINDVNMSAVEQLTAIAEDCGMSLLEFSLQWLLNREVVDSIIVGASKYEHVVQNVALASAKKPIPQDAMEKCNAVWDTIHGYWFSYHSTAKPPIPPKK